MSPQNDTYKKDSIHNIEFVKMHGIANDYVYVFDNGNNLPSDLNTLAIAISNRHCGIGGDGLVAISVSKLENADFRMRIFNADGSEAQMCGNASRCVGKLLYEYGWTKSSDIRLETLSGIKILHLLIGEDNSVESVDVDMSNPIFTPELIPVTHAELIDNNVSGLHSTTVRIEDREFRFYLVSLGNPHAVCFLKEKITDDHILRIGPKVEIHSFWPERTNVEFAKIINRHLIEMRVWERGSGETMACGTGACAVAIAAISLGLTDSPVIMRLTGGDLKIKWDSPSDHVIMSGNATLVADGIYHYDSESDNIWMHPRQ